MSNVQIPGKKRKDAVETLFSFAPGKSVNILFIAETKSLTHWLQVGTELPLFLFLHQATL